jgi:hypothetical protein
MILSHRTKPDSARTIVFGVAFQGTDKDTDCFEMSMEEAEVATANHFRWEFTLRRTLEEPSDEESPA